MLVGANLWRIAMRLEVVDKAVEVEVEQLGVLHEVGHLERVLMLEQHSVHLPELRLRARGLGGLGGDERVRMRRGQREVAKREAELIADRLGERLDDRAHATAERALEIAELDQVARAR